MFAGLSKRTTSEKLREAFSKFGEVVQGVFFTLVLCTYNQSALLTIFSPSRQSGVRETCEPWFIKLYH